MLLHSSAPASPLHHRLLSIITCCLLLTVAACAGKPPCPAQAPCQCTDLRIKCVQQESDQLHYLDRVPYFSPSNRETRWSYSFHELRIRDQAMTRLSLAFAWGVLSVKRVEVTGSLVRQIQPGAFHGLHGVESLNLSHNLLASLQADDLRDLPSLRELVLHNNLIKTVNPGAFQHTAFISKLYLSHNLISDIPPDVRQLSGLTHLYLQYNNIFVVPDNAFYGLRKLIILDLGALRSGLVIERRAFCGLTAATTTAAAAGQLVPSSTEPQDGGLVALYLRRNILHQLDLCAIGQARSLRGLNLTGTIFPCACQALSLASSERHDWLRRYGFAPRYVTYESGVLLSCADSLRHCPADSAQQPPPPCQDACRLSGVFDGSKLDSAPPLSPPEQQQQQQQPGSRDSTRFGYRMTVREGVGSVGDGGGGNGCGALHRKGKHLMLVEALALLALALARSLTSGELTGRC